MKSQSIDGTQYAADSLASQIGGWEKKYLTDLAAEWERLASEAEARTASWRSTKRDKSEPS